MIYILFGPPGVGKTTIATVIALKKMSQRGKKKRKVFSNFPIYNPRKKEYSYKWDKSYFTEVILDSDIFIDEAYMDYGSRSSGGKYAKTGDLEGFNKLEHRMFATTRHDNNNYYLIAQNYLRLDVVIREISMLYRINSLKIPILGWPVMFKIMGYASEIDMIKDNLYCNYWYFNLPFSAIRRAFKSFDTHYYRRKGETREDFPKWSLDDVM